MAVISESEKSFHLAWLGFQAEMKPVIKDAYNPHFGKAYADLSNVLVDALPILTKHKLIFKQTIRIEIGTMTNILVTSLTHIDGCRELSEILLPHDDNPQKFGAVLTYYKRYQAMAMLGVATEDDDANSASPAPNKGKEIPRMGKEIPRMANENPPTTKQVEMLKSLGPRKGVTGTVPKTSKEASAEIERLMKLPDLAK